MNWQLSATCGRSPALSGRHLNVRYAQTADPARADRWCRDDGCCCRPEWLAFKSEGKAASDARSLAAFSDTDFSPGRYDRIGRAIDIIFGCRPGNDGEAHDQ